MKINRKIKVSLAAALSAAICVSSAGYVFAGSDWGVYDIQNDGYGYLTANYPENFTDDFVLYENETGNAQLVQALMYTITSEQKASLLNAKDGYWEGMSSVGIPEVKESTNVAAPGPLAAAASFDQQAAGDYGTVLANAVKAENANMLSLADEEFGEAGVLAETQAAAAKSALKAGGVIAGLTSIGLDGGIEGLSDEEIDEAVVEKLTEIGKGGYLGMVQKSRDGLVPVDNDVPATILLTLTAEDTTELQTQLVQKSAVLLKNEDALPLSESADLSEINGAETAAVETESAVVIYVTDAEAQADFAAQQIENAKQNGKKAVLVLASAKMQNLDAFSEDCDAIVMAWGAVDAEAEAITPILTGEVNPSGKLPMAWPTEKEQADWALGYGLSYSEFAYEIVSAEPQAADGDDFGFDVKVNVTNNGAVDGETVVGLYLEDGSLAAFGRTEVIAAGETQEVALHVSQRGLSAADAEGNLAVQEGERTLFCGNGAADQSSSCAIEVAAARAGASVVAEAPETVKAGETFDVSVSTPVDVISLTMKDAEGNPYQPVDVLKQNLGESISFVYTLQIDEAGEAEVNIFTMTPQGPSTEAAAQVTVTVE